jgi:hypothetical protein
MTDYAVSMKDILVAAGVGTFATDLFVGKLPRTPDACVSVMQTGGKDSNPKWLLDYPSMQVMVRGAKNDYQGAYAKAVAVKDALIGYPSQDVNGDRWVQVNQLGDLMSLGFDEEDRAMFSLNWSLIIEPASGTYRITLT